MLNQFIGVTSLCGFVHCLEQFQGLCLCLSTHLPEVVYYRQVVSSFSVSCRILSKSFFTFDRFGCTVIKFFLSFRPLGLRFLCRKIDRKAC